MVCVGPAICEYLKLMIAVVYVCRLGEVCVCLLERVCGRWDVFSCDIICTFFYYGIFVQCYHKLL